MLGVKAFHVESVGLPAVVGLGLWSWSVALVACGVDVVAVSCRLVVEGQRQRTLLWLVQQAPAGTLVVMAESHESPAV